ncbi:hypothetical protein HY384_02020 [Candidatus Daviesbacteria bacterium]|nr:hypothetical protein [Candidatus Daviesbacteria bacterium]
MNNQQNQQNQQNVNSYEALDKLGKEIVVLKLSGLSYQSIVEYLEKIGEKRENQTVREWFINGGKYYEAYEFMKAKRHEEIEPEFKAIEGQIKEGAIDAIGVVRDQVKRGNLKAAMYLLKLAGFEVEQIKNISDESEEMKLLKEIIERNEQRSSTTHQIIQN